MLIYVPELKTLGLSVLDMSIFLSVCMSVCLYASQQTLLLPVMFNLYTVLAFHKQFVCPIRLALLGCT